MHDIRGKVVLITGASSGIGAAAAVAFGRHGARVAVHYRQRRAEAEAVAAQIEAAGGEAATFAADVSDSAQLDRLAAAVHARFGRIDVLINNAGGFVRRVPLAEASDALIDEVFHQNARSMIALGRSVIPMMRAQGGGTIINMGSILSQAGMANRSAYAASKAAIASFTKSMAFELGPHGITVNALGPTVIVTDLNRELVRTQPQLYDAVVKRTPLRRLGQPEDIAGALVFLASPAARFVTGQTLYVDGGYSAG